MNQKIRHGVYETNSSSTHSISIASKPSYDDTIVPDENGVIHLKGGEFGWEFESYNDAYTKASYCMIDTEDSPDKRAMLEKVIMEHTGAKKVIFDFSDVYGASNFGHIDHQSVGTSFDAFESEETLKRFLFNRSSYLYTGNDNV